MCNTCSKVGCNNPPYTHRSTVQDSLIGKVEYYLCFEHFTEMLKTRTQIQIFTLDMERQRGQQAAQR
jgi:hypothetical protein